MWFGRVGLFLVALCLVVGAINAAEFRRGRRGWSDAGEADAQGKVRVLFSVKQNNKGMSDLERTCLDVSNPSSKNYGNYVGLKAVADSVSNPIALQSVTDWVVQNGGENLQMAKTRDYISADLPIGAANKMFNVRLHNWRHPERPDISIVRSERGYLIPGHVDRFIDEVSGISGFPEVPSAGANGGRRNAHDIDDELVQADQRARRSVSASAAPPLPSPNDRLTFIPTLLPTILPTAKPAVNNLNCTGPGCPEVVHVLQYVNGVELLVRQKCMDNSISNSQQTPCGNLRPRNRRRPRNVGDPTSPLAYYLIGIRVIDPAAAQPGWTYFKIRPFRFQTNVVSIAEWNLDKQTIYRVPVTTGLPTYQPMEFTIQAFFLSGHASKVQPIPIPLQHTPAMTPAYLKTFYEIVSPPGVGTGNSQALMFPNKDNFWATDISKFAAEYKLQQPANFYTIGTPGGASGGNVSTLLPTVDGSFGIQNILGISPKIPTYFWSGPTADADFYASLFASLSSSENPPLVVGGSYFITEADAGTKMIERTNNELIKLCARGITFITTAGNTGAFNRNPSNVATSDCSAAVPVFPASSPYATTVGLTTPDNKVSSRRTGQPAGEIPVSGESSHGFTTGGGFSKVAARPAYQDLHVRNYLDYLSSIGETPTGLFDINGRAYPDVSFIGYNYRAFVAGTKIARGGDPVPAFAGMIALINSALIDRQLPPLGFLNPLLYSLATAKGKNGTNAAFYDVTYGNNKCGLGFVECCAQGFLSAPGWDAVSGLGTPYYLNIIDSALALPQWAFPSNETKPNKKVKITV